MIGIYVVILVYPGAHDEIALRHALEVLVRQVVGEQERHIVHAFALGGVRFLVGHRSDIEHLLLFQRGIDGEKLLVVVFARAVEQEDELAEHIFCLGIAVRRSQRREVSVAAQHVFGSVELVSEHLFEQFAGVDMRLGIHGLQPLPARGLGLDEHDDGKMPGIVVRPHLHLGERELEIEHGRGVFEHGVVEYPDGEPVLGGIFEKVYLDAAYAVVELRGQVVEDIVVLARDRPERRRIVEQPRLAADALFVAVVSGEIAQFVEFHALVERRVKIEVAKRTLVEHGRLARLVGRRERGDVIALPREPYLVLFSRRGGSCREHGEIVERIEQKQRDRHDDRDGDALALFPR